MKRILITGKNSYIGNQFEQWVAADPDFKVDKISVRDDHWKSVDFSQYDSVLHLAGIAHVSRNPKLKQLYYKVNRDLTVDLAKKAKQEGVNHFVFMSSIIVYGSAQTQISYDTPVGPDNFYGESKLQAEKAIQDLNSNKFKIAIIRPPMIYGKDSKGNYAKLSKLAKTLPFFPKIDNKRSMLHIDNLNQFLKLLISHKDEGLFFPQNNEYVNTSNLFSTIRKVHGKNIFFVNIFNPILNILIKRISIFNKLFDDLFYVKELSIYKEDYTINNFKESIKKTEF